MDETKKSGMVYKDDFYPMFDIYDNVDNHVFLSVDEAREIMFDLQKHFAAENPDLNYGAEFSALAARMSNLMRFARLKLEGGEKK